jgi:DNA mismatch repair protein MSH5
MQRSYNGLDALLTEVSKVLADQIPRGTSTLNIIYFPQLGFLISCIDDVDPEPGEFPGDEIAGWDRAFTDGGVAYYKSPEMTEMDQKFGDLYSMICDKEIEILHNLAQSILQYDDILITVSELAGDLDCLLALAQGAKNYRLVRPKITEHNVVDITGGRHILQEMTVPAFVANDTLLIGGNGGIHNETRTQSFLSEDVQARGTAVPATIATSIEAPQDGPSVLIMTGPNYSGKSVYLKQVALIVYMAHVGSFVPAEAATIGITDKILTRITTRESVSRMQSAFMIDLQQVSLALNLATPRSLIILDEFGKGTDSKGKLSNCFNVLVLTTSRRCGTCLWCTRTFTRSWLHVSEGGRCNTLPWQATQNCVKIESDKCHRDFRQRIPSIVSAAHVCQHGGSNRPRSAC